MSVANNIPGKIVLSSGFSLFFLARITVVAVLLYKPPNIAVMIIPALGNINFLTK